MGQRGSRKWGRMAYQEHALVQAIWTRLADQVVGNNLVLLRPAMVHGDLAELLRAGKGGLESVDTASKDVLGLVKDLFVLEKLEDAPLPVETLLGEQEAGQALDVDVGLGPLAS